MEHRILARRFELGEIGCETVLEKLAESGHCPNLLHDDNDKWALCFEGFQKLPMGNRCESISTTFIVQKKMWKGTIRGAVMAGLRSLR